MTTKLLTVVWNVAMETGRGVDLMGMANVVVEAVHRGTNEGHSNRDTDTGRSPTNNNVIPSNNCNSRTS